MNTICAAADLKGNIGLGSSNIFHPLASVNAGNYSIIIGNGNIFAPKSSIVAHRDLEIGSNNIFGPGSLITGSVGDNCVFGTRARHEIGHCSSDTKVLQMCSTDTIDGLMEKNIIVHPFGVRIGAAARNENQSQREYLEKTLANYHKVRHEI